MVGMGDIKEVCMEDMVVIQEEYNRQKLNPELSFSSRRKNDDLFLSILELKFYFSELHFNNKYKNTENQEVIKAKCQKLFTALELGQLLRPLRTLFVDRKLLFQLVNLEQHFQADMVVSMGQAGLKPHKPHSMHKAVTLVVIMVVTREIFTVEIIHTTEDMAVNGY